MSSDSLHEGYLRIVLADGTTTSTSTAAGPLVMLEDEQGSYTGNDEQRSDDEVVAWELRCDCSDASSPGPTSQWIGDRWVRVATPMMEDPENGRIYLAPGEDASDLAMREDVQAVVRARWLAEHVSPHEALGVIRGASSKIAAERSRLDEAVLFARATGETWASIGAAAGMSRQGAQDRWGSRTS